MPERILIAYASKKGSTAGIAKALGEELCAEGYETEVSRMGDVSSLDGYQGVIIGAPVYAGKVMKDLAGFVSHHKDALACLPVAAFTAGISPVYPKTGEIVEFTRQLEDALRPITPVAVTMFAGTLDTGRLSFVERGLTALLKVPTGDFRDWDLIAAWARELPDKMGLAAGTKG